MSDMITYDFIQNKYPITIFGDLYECPTKSEIESLGGELAVSPGYGSNECVKSNDVGKLNVVTVYRANVTLPPSSYYGVNTKYNVHSDTTIVVTLESGKQIVMTVPAGRNHFSERYQTKSIIVSAQISSANPDEYYAYQVEIGRDGTRPRP